MGSGDGRDSQQQARAGTVAQCCTRTNPEKLARLARVAKALADPIRLGMLDVMAQGRGCCAVIDPQERGVPGAGEPEGICVCEFQAQFGLGQSKASYHLRVLREAGLVVEETRGKWSFYAVDAERVSEALRDLSDVFGVDLGGKPDGAGWDGRAARPASGDVS